MVVSHDRYFMDKIVDGLFVFKGEGEVENFLEITRITERMRVLYHQNLKKRKQLQKSQKKHLKKES